MTAAGTTTSGPAYWDASGFHLLANPGGNSGGDFDFLDFTPVFDAGRQAAVWTKVGATYQLTLLTNANGSRFKGEVLDISNSGYAVGETSDGKGFIWHVSFDGGMLFDDWLLGRDIDLPTDSTSIAGLAEWNDELIFAVNGSSYVVFSETLAGGG